jgi:hypothetical protein
MGRASGGDRLCKPPFNGANGMHCAYHMRRTGYFERGTNVNLKSRLGAELPYMLRYTTHTGDSRDIIAKPEAFPILSSLSIRRNIWAKVRN